MKRFFSYDPEDGFSFHHTAEEAKAACLKAFSFYEDEAAGDGWPENTHEVCWGELKGVATQTAHVDRPPAAELNADMEDAEGNNWDNDFDSIETWEIVDTVKQAEWEALRGIGQPFPPK